MPALLQGLDNRSLPALQLVLGIRTRATEQDFRSKQLLLLVWALASGPHFFTLRCDVKRVTFLGDGQR